MAQPPPCRCLGCAPRRTANPQANAYYSDSTAMGRIKSVADRHGVSILVLHHTNKRKADDWTESISGSQGIFGRADGVVKMERERGWNADNKQTVMFEKDAVLTLGESKFIDMGSARAKHAVLHLEVLTVNHQRQTKAYTDKSLWLTRRIPDLYALNCTFTELEERWGGGEEPGEQEEAAEE